MIDDELLKRPIRSFFTILLHGFPAHSTHF